ncbi:MAG: PGPGW domain-containing protein [Pirellulales bacterium]|nr:PGPGW domain-containing protein [Pirellulales bacterium]
MMWEWISENRYWLLGSVTIGLGLSLAGLAAVQWLLVRIPRDYFTRAAPPPSPATASPASRWGWWFVRNVLGLLLLVAGIAMLILPGPGIIAMLLSLTLLDFPGRRTLERYLFRQRLVHRSMNSLRKKYGVEPLEIPSE